ncbi:hypothetical protein EF910_05535 [Streptomyces sp. WAC07149]|uniref:hypothetical protein n=1 Tax=Streptomyces sp. WAC07149 TaxID=2487425 RepID=UPI000F76FF38|nr:hypothetical protein [Streptomyces sp. WAC07149]RST07899.1 hypothetical protein EF910_05535 [Streptomyces sp. WAC07149]
MRVKIMNLWEVKADPGSPEWRQGYEEARRNLGAWIEPAQTSYDLVADTMRWEYWKAHSANDRATVANAANALCRLFSSAAKEFGDREAVRFLCRAYDGSMCEYEGRHVCVEQYEAELSEENRELAEAA